MTETKTKYPSAVYAAAGVGDFVYEQLRKLQNKAVALGSEAGAQAPVWRKKVAGLGAKVDANKVRESVVTGTQLAAEKATEVYSTLVHRGEKAFAAQRTPKPETTTPKAETTTPKAETAAPKTTPNVTAPRVQQAAKASTVATAPVAPVAKKAAPRKKAE